MGQVTGQIQIIAPLRKVWDVLADLSLSEKFNPKNERSYYISDEQEGLGSARRRDFAAGFLEERVVGWNEDNCISLEAYQLKGIPVKNAVSHYQISKTGTGTYVTHSIEYQPDGILGTVMMPVTRRRFQKEVCDLLKGLKEYLESARGWQVLPASRSVGRLDQPTVAGTAFSEAIKCTDAGLALAA